MKCKACNGRGWIFVTVGSVSESEPDIAKDICDECDGKGFIVERQSISPLDIEIPCSECEDGILVEEGSPHENVAGEDDATYFKCNQCGQLYNESGQAIKHPSSSLDK